MRPADVITINVAKRTVDLPGFLAAHGFEVVPDKDTRRHRVLAGPGGERVRVSIATLTGDWVWTDLRAGGGGNIVHACQRLLGLPTMREYIPVIRRAICEPPRALGIGHGGHTPTTAHAPLPSRTLPGLGSCGRRYLTGRHLDPTTVDAFAHCMGETPHGAVCAVHHQHGDGEERGSNWKAFHGSQDDGPGRGRSALVASPFHQGVPEQLLLAEAFIDCLSAWQELDTDLHSTVGIASTGGVPSAAGRDKLLRTLARMVEVHGPRIVPVLLDASDRGEVNTAVREQWLRDLAAHAKVEYRRLAPTHAEAKDWNESLALTARDLQLAEAGAMNADDPTRDLEPAGADDSLSAQLRGRSK